MNQIHREWTILSNHGIVLFHIAANPNTTQRELSAALGITERQVGRIVQDLTAAGMLQIQPRGRRNTYVVNPDAYLRHPTLSHIPLRCIITAVVPYLRQRVEASAERGAEMGSPTNGVPVP